MEWCLVLPHTLSTSRGSSLNCIGPNGWGCLAQMNPLNICIRFTPPTGGLRNEFYFHEHTLDRYMLMLGQLDIGLYDPRPSSSSFRAFTVVSLGQAGTGLSTAVRIPPGVWHSLRWMSDSGMFLVAKSPGYNQKTPDEIRIPMHELPVEITWDTV